MGCKDVQCIEIASVKVYRLDCMFSLLDLGRFHPFTGHDGP